MYILKPSKIPSILVQAGKLSSPIDTISPLLQISYAKTTHNITSLVHIGSEQIAENAQAAIQTITPDIAKIALFLYMMNKIDEKID